VKDRSYSIDLNDDEITGWFSENEYIVAKNVDWNVEITIKSDESSTLHKSVVLLDKKQLMVMIEVLYRAYFSIQD
jgi:hypothetical protein